VAPAPSPTSATSTSVPATPKSGHGQTKSQTNISLKKNSIYAVDLGGVRVSCKVKVRSPKPPLQDANLGAYGKKLVGCLMKAFGKPLAARGVELTTPKVKAYRRTIKTPCGRFSQRDAPAYYCSVTRTIYWPVSGDNSNEAYTFARLGYVGLVAHEFGHHMQAASGMLGEYGQRSFETKSRSERYRLSRRLELQAQCFEGIFLAATARSIGLSGNDRYQLRVWHTYTGDEDPPEGRKPDHGSSAAQLRWLNRGLGSADFGRCNTWRASKQSVK
jgi:predicted metalloprotease